LFSPLEIFFDYVETKSNRVKEKEKRDQKECMTRAEHTSQVLMEARQHQNGSRRGSHFMLGSQIPHCHDKANSGVVDSSEGVGRKD